MIKIALKKIKSYLFSSQHHNIELIRNINIDPDVPNQPRVLISYLCSIFYVDLEKDANRTYYFEINELIKSFINQGYCIDIVNCLSTSKIPFIKDTEYNVIFGFGDVFFKMTNLQSKAISILYMTENHPEISRVEEEKRKQYYIERHKRKVKYTRSGIFYKTEHIKKKYDHIITLSENQPFLNQYKQIFNIFPTGLVNSNFRFGSKNHETTQKFFLWLGSSGAVHKGLDLLLDIFKIRKDLNLFVCGLRHDEERFLKVPRQENIKIFGQININSKEFLEIVNNCTYIILPSCSEACSTSITTGMLHGLIPVVMKNSGFNRLESNAIFLESYQLEYIEDEINKLSSEYKSSELQIMSKKVFDFARENFIPSAFSKQFNKIINVILE